VWIIISDVFNKKKIMNTTDSTAEMAPTTSAGPNLREIILPPAFLLFSGFFGKSD